MSTLAANPGADLPLADAPDARVGHPRGLYVLFGAEMWERFSYYGMRALLVLYLVNYLKVAEGDAKALYATYTGLVYLTPLLGGFLADRYLGQRKAILVGGIVMAVGHFAMAFEPMLYFALALLILGNGFFKPNISSMVGNLYPAGDTRRDVAYTIFYMGINLGAAFAPLVCGALAESRGFGWHYGFGAAGVGMVLGLISFVAFQRHLNGGFAPGATRDRLVAVDYLHVVLVAAACIAAAYGISTQWPLIQGYVRYGVYAILVAYIGGMGFVLTQVARTRHVVTEQSVDWQRLAVILIVGLFSIVFWMGFEQAGGTLNLFADQKTDRSFGGRLGGWFGGRFGDQFPASWFQSVNPWLILALAPLLTILWANLDRTRLRVTSTVKMGLGLILLGLGFVVMMGALRAGEQQSRISPAWLTGFYLLATVGEICLSPIGLSLVNKLAPVRVSSLMMALWFTCTAVANYLAGVLDKELEDFADLTGYHIALFPFLVGMSIASGLLLLALTKPLKRMSHGRL